MATAFAKRFAKAIEVFLYLRRDLRANRLAVTKFYTTLHFVVDEDPTQKLRKHGCSKPDTWVMICTVKIPLTYHWLTAINVPRLCRKVAALHIRSRRSIVT